MKKLLIPLLFVIAAHFTQAATDVSYTATGDPGLANSGTDQNGNPVTVWNLTTSGTAGIAGSFFGDSSQNGGGGSGNPGSSGAGAGTAAWGLYSAGDASAVSTIDHTFDSPLAIGQTVSITLDNGYVNSGGGQVGLRLLGSGTFSFALSFIGGDSSYRYYDGASSGAGAFTYTDGGFTFSLTVTSTSTYSAVLTYLTTSSGTDSWTGTFGAGGRPTDIQVYTQNNQGGGAYDLFANNLAVTGAPEPGTWVMLLGSLGVFAACKRRGFWRR